MSLLERISVDPAIRFGKPCVRGTRLTVGDVLGYLAGGMSDDQVLADFPQLTKDDIRACLAYGDAGAVAVDCRARLSRRHNRMIEAPAGESQARRDVLDLQVRQLFDDLRWRQAGRQQIQDVGDADAQSAHAGPASALVWVHGDSVGECGHGQFLGHRIHLWRLGSAKGASPTTASQSLSGQSGAK